MRALVILPALLSAACTLTGPFDGYAGEESSLGGSDRCSNADVVRCFGFDDEGSIASRLSPGDDGIIHGHFDANQKVQGAGSLRFDVPAASAARSLVGTFALNFSPDEDVPASLFPERFGPGEEVYVQWRQRFDPGVLIDSGGAGFAQAVVGKGDVFAYESDVLEAPLVVIGNFYGRHLPQLALASGQPIQPDAPGGGVFLQNAVGCQSYSIEEPPCVFYHEDQWMTFQIGISIGHWGDDDSRIRGWVGLAAQPSVLVVDVMATLITQNGQADEKIGKVWFQLDEAFRPADVQNPAASFWVDDLVISRKPIADP